MAVGVSVGTGVAVDVGRGVVVKVGASVTDGCKGVSVVAGAATVAVALGSAAGVSVDRAGAAVAGGVPGRPQALSNRVIRTRQKGNLLFVIWMS